MLSLLLFETFYDEEGQMPPSYKYTNTQLQIHKYALFETFYDNEGQMPPSLIPSSPQLLRDLKCTILIIVNMIC